MITNGAVNPNNYLEIYDCFTWAIDRPFSLSTRYRGVVPQKINCGSRPYDNTLANDYRIEDEPTYISLGGATVLGGNVKVLLNNTKKAIFKFNRMPGITPEPLYIANYSLDGKYLNATGAIITPQNMLAKDDTAVEIYGMKGINNFFCSPVHSSMNPPAAYLLTVILFK